MRNMAVSRDTVCLLVALTACGPAAPSPSSSSPGRPQDDLPPGAPPAGSPPPSSHVNGLPIGSPRPVSFVDVAAASGLAAVRKDVSDFFDIHSDDYDGDGWPDIFISDHKTRHRLAMNDRNGGFANQPLPASDAQVWSMMAVDFNNDGRLDLSTNWDSASIKVYRNDGNRSFSSLSASQSYESQANGMAWADWNADGIPDYMVSGFFGNRSYMGRASGGFSHVASPAIPTQYAQASLYFADLDGDHFPDVLIQPTNATVGAGIFKPEVEHTTKILFNKGIAGAGAGFQPGVPNGLEACPGPGIALGDYDLDGDLDLFCAGSAPHGVAQPRKTFRVRLFQNQGNGTFVDMTEAAGLPTGDKTVNEYRVLYAQSVFADFDNDGRLDILWIEPEPGGIRLFQNMGGGSFQDVTAAARLDAYRHDVPRFMVTDFDRDGALDIVTMVGTTTPKLSLLKNEVAGTSWLDVTLEGTHLKTATNSKIHVYEAGHLGDAAHRVGYREVLLAYSHRAPLAQHFAALPGLKYDVRVQFWPERNTVDVRDLPGGQRVRIRASGGCDSF
ncbi:VCBS repeat-containing protein [Pendulispora brunnea]|uniref:VCBS repeat-containing protein n=1 Tax=Pendulispora brunnea TaxID=2905690 RepID=A0ABZ2KB96_9BACT